MRDWLVDWLAWALGWSFGLACGACFVLILIGTYLVESGALARANGDDDLR